VVIEPTLVKDPTSPLNKLAITVKILYQIHFSVTPILKYVGRNLEASCSRNCFGKFISRIKTSNMDQLYNENR